MSQINEKLSAGARLDRHMHDKPYVTLVLEGHYLEAGDHGRFHVEPGDILMHGHFASHANWIAPRRDVKTLNIELKNMPAGHALYASDNFDDIVKFAQCDLPLAVNELFSSIVPKTPPPQDWPELLAEGIRNDPTKTIGHWCHVLGLAPATVSRGFKRAFGVTVAQYKATVRTRCALLDLHDKEASLGDLAYRWGFSDQAHLTRSIRVLTGKTPSYWQRVKNIQDEGRSTL